MKNDFLYVARKALLKGNRLESLHILTGNVTDADLIHQLQELEIRQNSLAKKINAGTIDFEDIQKEENRVSSAILVIINNLERNINRKAKPPPPPTKPKKGFDIKWLVIGLLVVALLAIGYVVLSQKSSKKLPTNPCAKIDCQNGGKCDNGRCKCPSGYEGKLCETKIATADPCKNIKCLNNGRCKDGRCQCPPGYEGKLCEIKIAEEFKMIIEDVFSLTGRGTVVTGKIASGEIKKGDRLKIMINGKEVRTVCLGIEAFKKQLVTAKKDDSVGLLLRGVDKGDLKKGMVVTK